MQEPPFRILYVEDNQPLRETIALLMDDDGREVVQAANAEEALVACARGPFELVITDLSLPGRSGTDLARELLARDRDRWIVLCSGRDPEVDLGGLGPNVRPLMKPFEYEELDRLIRAARGTPA